jgi:23S rRNA pseudouridine2605 synthase
MKPSDHAQVGLVSHPQRLQKVLAAAGLGSRRKCEEFIVQGRVEVDRQIVTELGKKVDPHTQAIRVDGVPLKRSKRRYFAIHKPRGFVSTANDPSGRARVIDLIDSRERVFTIGRLDKESSGLILATNDGELANRLAHPRYQVEKTYHVTVAGSPGWDIIGKLRQGIVLSDGATKPKSVTIKKKLKQSTVLEIVLTEGHNREIRRMLARVGHKVLKLHRISIGPVRLGMLPVGAHRELTKDELARLQRPQNLRSAVRKKKSLRAKPAGPRKTKREPAKQKFGTVLGGSGSTGRRGATGEAAKKSRVNRRKARQS